MQRLAIYGAGNKMLDVEEILSKYRNDVECLYAIENKQFSKIGSKLKCRSSMDKYIQVISVNELKRLYSLKEIDGVVYPTTYHLFDWKEIVDICLNMGGLKEESIFAVPIDILRKTELTNVDLERILTPYKELAQLYHLDIHIVDKCNIKCKGCAHFSSLADDWMITVNKFKENLIQLNKLIPNICEIAILGGEPLLHPQLGEILKVTKEVYPYVDIDLITNGIMLTQMDEKLVNTIVNNRVTVRISMYPLFKERLETWLAFLRQNKISYIVTEFNKFERRLWYKPIFNGRELTKRCGHDLVMRDNMIARCPLSLFVGYYNKVFNYQLPENKGINIYKINSGKELIRLLEEPVGLCDYCCARDHCYEIWELVTRENMSASDWFMKLPIKLVEEMEK